MQHDEITTTVHPQSQIMITFAHVIFSTHLCQLTACSQHSINCSFFFSWQMTSSNPSKQLSDPDNQEKGGTKDLSYPFQHPYGRGWRAAQGCRLGLLYSPWSPAQAFWTSRNQKLRWTAGAKVLSATKPAVVKPGSSGEKQQPDLNKPDPPFPSSPPSRILIYS